MIKITIALIFAVSAILYYLFVRLPMRRNKKLEEKEEFDYEGVEFYEVFEPKE